MFIISSCLVGGGRLQSLHVKFTHISLLLSSLVFEDKAFFLFLVFFRNDDDDDSLLTAFAHFSWHRGGGRVYMGWTGGGLDLGKFYKLGKFHRLFFFFFCVYFVVIRKYGCALATRDELLRSDPLLFSFFHFWVGMWWRCSLRSADSFLILMFWSWFYFLSLLNAVFVAVFLCWLRKNRDGKSALGHVHPWYVWVSCISCSSKVYHRPYFRMDLVTLYIRKAGNCKFWTCSQAWEFGLQCCWL